MSDDEFQNSLSECFPDEYPSSYCEEFVDEAFEVLNLEIRREFASDQNTQDTSYHRT
jgi:hypothetical protein